MALSVAIAVGSMWIGLLVSNAVASIPPSFAILAVSSGVYAATFLPSRNRASKAREDA